LLVHPFGSAKYVQMWPSSLCAFDHGNKRQRFGVVAAFDSFDSKAPSADQRLRGFIGIIGGFL
jgi:hypothetical protein